MALLATAGAIAQVEPDRGFDTSVGTPAYSNAAGPLVLIDEAHYNAHTISGRYAPFAALLRNDGFRVEPLKTAISSPEQLGGVKILVVANAAAPRVPSEVNFPVKSAFGAAEIAAVQGWVWRGGSLFLIADHPPWAGAAEDLASAFGVYFANGYALRDAGKYETFLFQRTDGTLRAHAVTNGRGSNERVSVVATFTGQAFRAAALKLCWSCRVTCFCSFPSARLSYRNGRREYERRNCCKELWGATEGAESLCSGKQRCSRLSSSVLIVSLSA